MDAPETLLRTVTKTAGTKTDVYDRTFRVKRCLRIVVGIEKAPAA